MNNCYEEINYLKRQSSVLKRESERENEESEWRLLLYYNVSIFKEMKFYFLLSNFFLQCYLRLLYFFNCLFFFVTFLLKDIFILIFFSVQIFIWYINIFIYIYICKIKIIILQKIKVLNNKNKKKNIKINSRFSKSWTSRSTTYDQYFTVDKLDDTIKDSLLPWDNHACFKSVSLEFKR